MHSYLRAIGFSNLTKESEVENLLDEVYRSFDERNVAKGERSVFLEMKKEYAPGLGIIVCGILDEEGFHRQYYFPYFDGNGITTKEDLTVDLKVNGQGFAGVVDDNRVGISVIFYVRNAAEYLREQILNKLFGRKITVTLSGLSTNGMILLPLKQSGNQLELQRKSQSKRNHLINAAKKGDPEAIEDLSMDDMDLYSMVSRRVYTEDVYTIVDTFFMPYGIECDMYQIMGKILFYTKIRNPRTKDYIYKMNIECNDFIFDICINASDLTGDPEVGRRFKGSVWLQGKINFDES